MSRISSVLLLCIITISMNSFAQSGSRWGSGIDFSKRAANRESGRWSLSEWLEMKNRNRMMDMWLSMNSPSPFEFSLSGAYISYSKDVAGATPTTTSLKSYSGEASAYAQFVGLTLEYENNTEEGFHDLTGLLNLRLLGNSIQNTALTLSLGQSARDHADGSVGRYTRQLGQATLQVYLTKYFGLEGKYRQYSPTSNEALGDINGNLSEAGLFIDFNALRIFGTWFQETQKTKIPAASEDSVTDRTGIKSGIKIFF